MASHIHTDNLLTERRKIMPNWCNNELIIKGSPKELSKLIKQVEITNSEETSTHPKTQFSCQKVMPRPASQDNDWYSWNINHWGSKWDLDSVSLDESKIEERIIRYSFQTAWSPVVEVILALAGQFKKLSFQYNYYESGMDFWGIEKYKKGVVTSSESGSISEADCKLLLEVMGDHHYCLECYDYIPCDNEETPQLCDDCENERNKEESSLWEGETNESATQQSVEVA